MTRLIVTTNRRGALADESSGLIIIVDLENQKILQQTSGLEPPYRTFDTNPRGGMRGMRGLSFNNGELAAADYSSVFFFDKQWNLLRAITHPSVSGIHEIIYIDNGVWVTSTVNDLLARLDLEGNLTEIHYLREQKQIMRQLNGPHKIILQREDILAGKLDFRTRSNFKSHIYDRMHFNSLAIAPDGRKILSLGLITGDIYKNIMNTKAFVKRLNLWNKFLSLNRYIRQFVGIKKKTLSDLVIQPGWGKSAIISVDGSGKWNLHVQFHSTHIPSHSVRILDNGTCLYLNSSQGAIVHFSLDGKVFSSHKVTDEFLRGLLVLPGGQLVVGAGNTLLVYELNSGKVLSEILLTDDSNNSVFDIQIFPPDFVLPPSSLQDKVGKMIGFNGQNIVWENNASANSDTHS